MDVERHHSAHSSRDSHMIVFELFEGYTSSQMLNSFSHLIASNCFELKWEQYKRVSPLNNSLTISELRLETPPVPVGNVFKLQKSDFQ